MKDAPALLRDDRLIVLAAVQQYGHALKQASSELRTDTEIVLAAVTQYESALQYATRFLCDDENIVLAAVTPSVGAFAAQDGRAFSVRNNEITQHPQFCFGICKTERMDLTTCT